MKTNTTTNTTSATGPKQHKWKQYYDMPIKVLVEKAILKTHFSNFSSIKYQPSYHAITLSSISAILYKLLDS